MMTRFDRWAWYGAACLALIAGIVNAVGFLSFAHQTVTHLTGVATQFGVTLSQQNVSVAANAFFVIFSFFLGAAGSGFILKQSTLRLGRRYGFILMLESLCLFIAARLMEDQIQLGAYIASLGCGLQNGMVSTYSGAVIRTTHMTGIITDLGIALGQALRGTEVDRLRVRLYLILLGGFVCGGAFGAALFAWLHYATLYVPAALVGGTGLGYIIYVVLHPHHVGDTHAH